jgi:sec-independent protein translocase protein TatC
MITIDTYIPVVLKLIVAFGLVFQVPLILFVLGCFGIVTSEGLRAKRRLAIVISFVMAMILTPPDPMSQIIMAIPLCTLYEIAIWAVWLKEKGTFRR